MVKRRFDSVIPQSYLMLDDWIAEVDFGDCNGDPNSKSTIPTMPTASWGQATDRTDSQ